MKTNDKSGLKHTKPLSKAKKLAKAVKTTLILGLALANATFIGSEVTHAVKTSSSENYKTAEKIENDINSLKPNTFLLDYFVKDLRLWSNYTRLAHNNNKPIYVAFNSNVPEQEKKHYFEVLDYYQKLFEQINPKYRFEVVPENQAIMQHFLGNTTITFKQTQSDFFDGKTAQRTNFFNNEFLRVSRIKIALNQNQPDELKRYVIMHELAHAFGLGDVYAHSTGSWHHDTFMQPSPANIKLGMLYPNDVAILQVLYNQDLSKQNGTVNQAQVLKAKNMLQDYEQKFYQKVQQFMFEQFKQQHEILPFQQHQLQSGEFWFNDFYYDLEQAKQNVFAYKIQLNNSLTKATFSIYDSHGKQLFTTQTDAKKVGEVVYLPSVYLPKGRYPGQDYVVPYNVTTDLFFALANTASGYKLYDIGNRHMLNSKIFEFEPQKANQNNTYASNNNTYASKLNLQTRSSGLEF